MTSGFHPGQLIIIAARPGMGKTALVLNMAERMSVDHHVPVVFFSLEMSHQELALRLLCSRARLNLKDLKRGYMARDNWPAITTNASQIGESPLYFDFSTSPTVMEIRSAARRYAHECARRGMGLGCIIIDYLQLMRGAGKVENRQQEIAEISRSLKGLARELQIPVIALAQFNRRPDEREGRPQISDLRESGAIEQDADVVLAIYREGMYKRDDPDLKTAAKLFVLKQRNGPVGDVPLQFFEEWTRFEDAEREYNAVPN
jgi:replicative DNA helicase